MATTQRIAEEKIAVLKLEITILSDKLNNIIGSLWKIRRFSLALWLAAIGLGLGALSSSKSLVPEILVISFLIPLLFFWIDVRYIRWYRRYNLREKHIQQFMNNKSYILPSSNTPMKFNEMATSTDFAFPVYDLAGQATFGKASFYRWNTSLARCLIDSIPVFIYGSQMFGSAILSTLYLQTHWRLLFVPCFGLFLFVLFLFGVITKWRIMKSDIK